MYKYNGVIAIIVMYNYNGVYILQHLIQIKTYAKITMARMTTKCTNYKT